MESAQGGKRIIVPDELIREGFGMIRTSFLAPGATFILIVLRLQKSWLEAYLELSANHGISMMHSTLSTVSTSIRIALEYLILGGVGRLHHFPIAHILDA